MPAASPNPWLHRLLALALAAGVVLFLLWPALDGSLLARLSAWGRAGPGHVYAEAAYWAGLGGLQAGVFVLLALWGWWRRRPEPVRLGLLAAVAVGVSGIAAQVVKHLLGRPRPRMHLDPSVLIGPTWDSDFSSFPSGHAATSFALAAVLAGRWPKLAWLFYGLAAAVCLGRVAGNSHYPSDVLGGALLGLMAGLPLAARLNGRGGRL